jgi:deoxyribonuclease-4
MTTPIGYCAQTVSTISDLIRVMYLNDTRAVQITLGDPSSQSLVSIDDEDATTVRAIRKRHKFYVVVHGKYLYNFCRDASWQHSLLVRELQQADKIGADVIIHQGKNMAELKLTKDAAHQAFADNVSAVLEDMRRLGLKNKLVLENSARQGTECGYSLDDLYDIYMRIPDRSQVAFCIDLCHIFVAGELDVRVVKDVQAWFERFDKLIGLDRLSVLHFNDSNTDYNGANDNHGSIGRGYIGSVSTEGFQYVCRLATSYKIPLILETSPAYMKTELPLVKKWCC